MTVNQKYWDCFERLKRYLYIGFVLCFFFYTAFKVSLWNDETISYYFEKAFQIVDCIKSVLIYGLLIGEIITVIEKIRWKQLEKQQVGMILCFGLFYLLMKRYAYYWRFDELIIFIYFSRYLEFDKIVYLYLAMAIGSAICNIVGCLTGELTIDTGLTGLVLGFSHYNGASLFYTMLYFGLAYCLRKHKNVVVVLSLPFLYLIHYVIKSRTPFYIILIFLCLMYLEPLYKMACENKWIQRVIHFIYIVFPILLTVIAIILGIKLLDNSIYIDYNASIRFKEFVWAYKERGLATYYRDLLDSSRHYYFDNGYAQLIFKHGLIPTAIIYFLWILNGIKVVKDKNFFVMVLNICLFLYMMMEFVMINDFMLVMMTYFMANSYKDNKELSFLNIFKD